MRTFRLLLLLGSLTFAACNSTADKKTDQQLEKTAVQAFTDTLQQDTFSIVSKGKTAKDMSLLFTIKNFKGVEIYKKEIKAEDLLQSYLASSGLKSEAEKLKFLTDEVNFFFDEEHFLVPAVTADETPDNNAPDKFFFEELKRTQLNGFSYRLGKDTNIYIAWSDVEKKVKVYYQCC